MQTAIPDTSMFLIIGLLILVRRIRSMYKPTKGRGGRLIFPLLFLTPGFSLFLNASGHVTYLQLSIAIIYSNFFRSGFFDSSYFMVRL